MISFISCYQQLCSFADDNTWPCFVKTIPELTAFLESKCEATWNFFDGNKMIVNPGKFQAIIIDNTKQDHANETLKAGSK